MCLQITLRGKRLCTNITLEWFHTRVDKHVYAEITSLGEGLAAVFACVWLLPCVKQHVLT